MSALSVNATATGFASRSAAKPVSNQVSPDAVFAEVFADSLASAFAAPESMPARPAGGRVGGDDADVADVADAARAARSRNRSDAVRRAAWSESEERRDASVRRSSTVEAATVSASDDESRPAGVDGAEVSDDEPNKSGTDATGAGQVVSAVVVAPTVVRDPAPVVDAHGQVAPAGTSGLTSGAGQGSGASQVASSERDATTPVSGAPAAVQLGGSVVAAGPLAQQAGVEGAAAATPSGESATGPVATASSPLPASQHSTDAGTPPVAAGDASQGSEFPAAGPERLLGASSNAAPPAAASAAASVAAGGGVSSFAGLSVAAADAASADDLAASGDGTVAAPGAASSAGVFTSPTTPTSSSPSSPSAGMALPGQPGVKTSGLALPAGLAASELTVDLSEEGLGQLTVSAATSTEGLHLKLTTTDTGLRDLIRERGAELRREFEQSGTALGSFDVSARGDRHSNTGQQHTPAAAPRTGRADQVVSRSEPATRREPAARNTTSTDASVDVWI